MAMFKKSAGKTGEVDTRTTDVEDIQLLSDAIVALVQESQFDDMTWAEIDNALMRASHQIKLNWQDTGSVQPAPPPDVEPPAARR